MGVPSYVICHFSLIAFNILSLSLILIRLTTMHLSLFLLGFILPGTLCFLNLVNYFLSHVWEVFSYYLFKYFLMSFLSLFSCWEPYNAIIDAFNAVPEVSQAVLIFFPHSFFYILFCGDDFHHSVLQAIYLFCLSYSALDSFQPIIHLCLFFSSCRSLFTIS